MAHEVGWFGVGGTGQEQVLVDLDAAGPLPGRQQVEFDAGDATTAERSDHLAGRDWFLRDGGVARGASRGNSLWGEIARGHGFILSPVTRRVYSLMGQPF
jgi:hypothetical protein